MASQQNCTEPNREDLPLVLLHYQPPFDIHIFKHHLRPYFRLLDPSELPEPTNPFSSRAKSLRALVSVGIFPVTRETLSLLPSLELVVGSSAGVNHIDLQECRRRGIAVTNTGPAFCEDAADYAVALLIDVLRRLSACDRYVRDGLWPEKGDYPLALKLGGKRVGIVGLGNIGSEVAKRLLAFGCSIAYNSRRKKDSVSFPYYANVSDLATNSDVLILCCPLTDETRHMINKDAMNALGKEGVIINIGRGALVDEKELVQFLVNGDIRGAGLDVFENEPHVPEKLYALDNVVLSPHRAVITPESFEAAVKLVLANLKAFFSNEPLLSPVQN
ncbi:putative glycerate dehydrogenase [Tripterygium wilfordii]|uniref:glyoxylate reductase (NADP(+)) n=1 Tax=Tripterygium wilfordii TaxID=458696 RepID=A0A7J7CLD1_TRIWF|nr:glyoxylate/hydroxypyruvate reductase HPR3-like [Tripterygium wilfordii]KAF5734849.1 putative glycerate dehydrogenase [Tripterygium wilfordii]